jgi:hypothetical protein
MGSGVNVSGSRGNSFSEDDVYGQVLATGILLIALGGAYCSEW